MSIESLVKFAEVVNADKELQRRICATADVKELAARAVLEGAARGFEFTAAEVESSLVAAAPSGRLSDELLEAAAGGATGGAGSGKIKFNEFTIKKTSDS